MKKIRCTHIKNMPLSLFQLLLEKKRNIHLYCTECGEEEVEEKNDIETAEMLNICVYCLHVGCTTEKKGHALHHFETHRDHVLSAKPTGELYCHGCETPLIEFDEADRITASELQKIFKDFIIKSNPDKGRSIKKSDLLIRCLKL